MTWCTPGRSEGSGTGCAGRSVVLAQGAQEVLDGHIEGVGEGVPGGNTAGGAAVFEVDEGAPGQTVVVGEFVEGPAALGPQAREHNAQRSEVGAGGKIVTPPSDGADPCPVSAGFCTFAGRSG